jgi:hypothetical protein
MTGSAPRCPSCGEDLVLQLNQTTPPDDQAVVLCADPPFRYECTSPSCSQAPEDTGT